MMNEMMNLIKTIGEEKTIDVFEDGIDCQVDLYKLTDVNHPVQLSEALIHFYNNAEIIVNDENIMNHFPMLKNGYSLRSTLGYIFMFYCKINNLKDEQYILPDKLMNESFNDNIKAKWYRVNNEKILMRDVAEKLNTFQVISKIKHDFNREKFPNYIFQYIHSLNMDNIELSNEMINELFTECKLIKEYHRKSY
jgi:hypothetical protein